MIPIRRLVLDAYPDYPSPEALPDISVEGIECDSRKVENGYLFVAVRGAKLDGASFVEEAAKRGACAVAGETKPASTQLPYIRVEDSRDAAARLASAFYGDPSKKMKLIGVTGTNGKTTTTYLIEHLLRKSGRKAGAIGTISYRYGGVEHAAKETTPGPLALQKIFSEMAASKCEKVVMEVSSHALDQSRVTGLDFAAAVFTNLTQDHLDYHGSMDKYFESKAKLFRSLAPDALAVLNSDDAWSEKLKPLTKARIVTYGIEKEAGLRARGIVRKGDTTGFELCRLADVLSVRVPLIGRHNVYNALAAIACCEGMGMPLREAADHLADFPGVPGRLEAVRCGQDFTVLIDFAHTPDGLENVLRSLAEQRTNRLLVVFGCGGDRDRTKRPKMADIASRWADQVYVTSDNPRSEDPKVIAEEVCAGFPPGFRSKFVVLDRRKAIRQALLSARTGDIVLLAGKGHERTQIVGERTLPFSDREEAQRVLTGH